MTTRRRTASDRLLNCRATQLSRNMTQQQKEVFAVGRRLVGKYGRVDLESEGVPLLVAQSSFPGAGLGVFATKDIPAHCDIIGVCGKFVTTADQPDTNRAYSFTIENGLKYGTHENDDMPNSCCLDCYDPKKTNVVRYINSALGSRVRANVKIVWHRYVPILCSCSRQIRKGEELLLDYWYDRAANVKGPKGTESIQDIIACGAPWAEF